MDGKLELFYHVVGYIDETNSLMHVVCSLNMQQCEQVLFLFVHYQAQAENLFFFFFFCTDFEGNFAEL